MPPPLPRGLGPAEADAGRRDGPAGHDEREGEGARRVDAEVEAPHDDGTMMGCLRCVPFSLFLGPALLAR
ncbi:hypothetical protein THAOC_12998 [Thalassiosira oceanica]|uniref:Uncharacterized protein n=1 Tax=Thalassiosira oceanica TaxID=159749 RepID=K0SL74_THAOC|nr:hypothetical protein THAOC_12998 [Thalassiosira oceanica]|eukprot:EJK66100.1 hypothetical protein THAOC_12998 [Thalassiosira oceanica]